MSNNEHTNSLITEVNWQPRNSWRAVRMLHRVAAHAAHAEGFTRGRLSIAVVGATAMATLHLRFLNQPGPTDVLTFDLDTDRDIGHIDGEVVVCTDVALRRAACRSRSLQAARAELALYVVHGVLHLAGYDDRTPAAFRRIHAREDEILTELGFGHVYRDGITTR